jgi:glycosyltransferase involved in cell wall biosynthesis
MSRGDLISVITPSYNQSEFIEDTIDSVERQGYDRIEHIVVDGESDDGTVDLLRQRDVQWTSEADDGQADALNKGFERASGDIIAWFNSDDVIFDVGVLERVARYFETTGADVVYGDMALIDSDSEVLKLHCVPDFDYERLLRYCFIVQPSLFFRSDILDDHLLDPSLEYVMDYEFWLRIAEDYQFAHVNDVLSGDRNHPQRKILNDRDQMLQEAEEIARQYGRTESGRSVAGQVSDAATSGIPRRIESMVRTVQFHRSPPELAFDGSFRSLPQMLTNVWRSNEVLV